MIEDSRHDIMKTSQIMIATAVLLAAVFAGIVLTDEEYSAAEAESYTITYECDGGVLYQTGAAGVAVDLYKDEATAAILGLDANSIYELAGWQTTGDNPSVYRFNEEGKASIVLNSDITLVPFLQIKTGVEVAYFVFDGETYTLQITEGKVTLSDELLDAIGALGKDRSFKGWFDAAGNELEAETGEGNENTFAVSKDATYTAKVIDVYTVAWVVDGITVSEGTSEAPAKPASNPSKDNYTFTGWYDADGMKYVTDGDAKYVFSKDTTFTAKFEADLVSVTFMVGDAEYDSMEVRYGGTASKVALPEGYAYWAVQTKAPVYTEDGVTVVTPAEYAEYDFSKAVTSSLTLYAIAAETPEPDESIYATFNIEGTIYGPYKVTDRFSIPQTDREGYEFLGWTVQGGDGTKLTSVQVQNYQYTEDVTFVAVYEVVEPPAPEEPGFFETSTGKTVAVLIAFVVILLIAAVYLNLWDLRTKLFGWKIERKGKE